MANPQKANSSPNLVATMLAALFVLAGAAMCLMPQHLTGNDSAAWKSVGWTVLGFGLAVSASLLNRILSGRGEKESEYARRNGTDGSAGSDSAW